MVAGKRASPGADEFKAPFNAGLELSEENTEKLSQLQKEIGRVELVNERNAQKNLASTYSQRREIVKNIPHFWPIAMLNHGQIGFHAQHGADQSALAFLEDLWVERNADEPRVFTIELYFKENPYFTDSVLKKEFKLKPSASSANDKPDADGITEAMLEFSWENHVEHSSAKIHWKSDDKNLTKLYPRAPLDEEDGDDIPADAGSFFNFFEHSTDPFDLGLCIANELWGDAIDHFLGRVDGDIDSEDEDDSDDDDDAAEIDLDKPRSKKQKSA